VGVVAALARQFSESALAAGRISESDNGRSPLDSSQQEQQSFIATLTDDGMSERLASINFKGERWEYKMDA
jgi:hypothetical protein